MNHATTYANPPAPSAPAWRGWLLVFAAFWASFAPAWAALMPVGVPFDGASAGALTRTSAPKYQTGAAQYKAAGYKPAPGVAPVGPKNRVGDFFTAEAKTHWETLSQVAGSHQEKAICGHETASVLTIYAHANPVSGFDPSGHITLYEIMGVTCVIGALYSIAIPQLTVNSTKWAVVALGDTDHIDYKGDGVTAHNMRAKAVNDLSWFGTRVLADLARIHLSDRGYKVFIYNSISLKSLISVLKVPMVKAFVFFGHGYNEGSVLGCSDQDGFSIDDAKAITHRFDIVSLFSCNASQFGGGV